MSIYRTTTDSFPLLSGGMNRQYEEDSMSVLLKVQDLKTQFNTEHGVVKAVDGVSYELDENEIIGIAI